MKTPNGTLKKLSLVLGVIIALSTVGGLVWKSVSTVQTHVGQIETNKNNIQLLDDKAELEKLCKLHRKALSDWYYWDEQCKKTHAAKACEEALAAKSRVDRLEKQIQKLEEKTGETC